MEIPSHISQLGGDLFIATKALLKSGETVRKAYEDDARKPAKTILKRVTRIDRGAEKALRRAITASLKVYNVQAEENRRRDHPTVVTDKNESLKHRVAKQTWIVHPLDATSGPMIENGSDSTPAMMIAGREGEVTPWSLVYFPLTNELFYAIRGIGAFCAETRLESTPVTLSEAQIHIEIDADPDKVKTASTSYRALVERLRTKENITLIEQPVVSSAAPVRTCCGDLVAVIYSNPANHIRSEAPRDVLAPKLVLEETGGCFITLSGAQYDPFRPEPFIAARTLNVARTLLNPAL